MQLSPPKSSRNCSMLVFLLCRYMGVVVSIIVTGKLQSFVSICLRRIIGIRLILLKMKNLFGTQNWQWIHHTLRRGATALLTTPYSGAHSPKVADEWVRRPRKVLGELKSISLNRSLRTITLRMPSD